MADGREHRFPEPTARLALGGERSDWSPRATLDHALAAVFALSPVAEPLSLELQLGFRRGEEQRRESNHWLRVPHPALEGLGPSWYDEEVLEVERVTREQAMEIAGRALDQADRAGERLAWYSLASRAMRARVVEDSVRGRDHLVLATEIGAIDVPIERDRGAWVTSPSDGAGSPVTISIEGEEYDVVLTLTLRWSLWTDPDGAGREQVERALAALEREGWEREVR